MSSLHDQIIGTYNTSFRQWYNVRGSVTDAAEHVASELCKRLGVPNKWKFGQIALVNDEAFAQKGEIAVSYDLVARFCVVMEFETDPIDNISHVAKLDMRMQGKREEGGQYAWELLWTTKTSKETIQEMLPIYAPATMDIVAEGAAKQINAYFSRLARNDAWGR